MWFIQGKESADSRKTERELSNRLSEDWFIRLHQVREIQVGEDQKLAHQLSHTYVLVVALHGSGKLYLDNREYLLEPNTYGFCLPAHTWGARSDNRPLKLYQFTFHTFQKIDSRTASLVSAGEELPELRKEPEEPGRLLQPWVSEYGELNGGAGSSLQRICESIMQDWDSKDLFARYHANVGFEQLLYVIWTNSRSAKRTPRASMEQVRRYIEQNYDASLTIGQLAQLAGVSSNYFVGLFKKTFGISAMEYAAECKMTQAKRRMARGNVKLKEVASQVGYEDEFYFSRKFKKHTGLSPTQYMNARRRRIAAYSPSVCGHLLALNRIPYAAPLHPKWTEYYYENYRNEIPVHLSAYRHNVDWSSNVERLMNSDAETLICLQPLRSEEEALLQKAVPDLLIVPEHLHWREQFWQIAEYLGDEAEANSWLSRYKQKVKWGQAQLRQSAIKGQLLILRVFKNQLYLHRSRGAESVLIDSLGLELASVPKEPNVASDQSNEVTMEQLSEINPDYLFVLIYQETETLVYWDELQTTECWQGLQAVRSGHLYQLSSDPWREYSAYSQLRMIDEAVRLFSVHSP
ncbi:AraC family transcriptional regulator [Paenibacillus senegalensis]|uniref:AraC family transcriptional regulator n=1 Tax=Paenibacillus senegalensis TaxID=1465766 RepID=UPI0002881256|nr:AraC family transcriptional regulator [Paenibacillus senegalensis]